jgi:microcystin-dependent protein
MSFSPGDVLSAADMNAIAAALVPTGSVTSFAGSAAPTGWLLCDGANVSRSTFATLFAAIGTTYGVGDGSTTFGLPNLRGRVPVGFNASETEFDALGKTGGAKTHTLTTAELPVHQHGMAHTHNVSTQGTTSTTHSHEGTAVSQSGTGFSAAGSYATGGASTANTGNTGSGTAHNNLSPYIALNFIIKA